MARANQIHSGFNWSKAIKEHGLEFTILWRTWFHNGMTAEDLSGNTGLSEKTCQKHLNKLCSEGKLFWVVGYKMFKVSNPNNFKYEDMN